MLVFSPQWGCRRLLSAPRGETQLGRGRDALTAQDGRRGSGERAAGRPRPALRAPSAAGEELGGRGRDRTLVAVRSSEPRALAPGPGAGCKSQPCH